MTDKPNARHITDADIWRGYDLCAILHVCELATEQIPELGQDAMVNEAVGAVARLLSMAGKMAGESLELLELLERRD